jgi:type I restriction enzyme S subunit
MASEWGKVPFEALLSEPVRNGIYKKKEFHGRGTKIVNMGELFAHPRLRDVPMKRVELNESEASRFLLAEGDLIFARRSLTAEGAGKCSIVLEVKEDTTFESSIIRARPDRNKSDPLYLYYFFNSSLGIHSLDTIRRQVAVAGITGSDLARLDILVPPLQIQRAIAHILGTLDDKIELNRRQNETLEAMARALFKAWFVDFEPVRAKMEGRWQRGLSLPGLPAHLYDLFPDRLVESELGEIPEGWEVKSFADTVEIIGGGTPKTSVAEYWDGDIPWFSVVDAPLASDVWVLDTEKKITHAGVENSSTRILPVGTTILSARGTVGRLALVGVPMAMNQSCYGLRGKLGHRGFFNYFTTRQLVSTLQHRTHGSVFDTITRDTLAGVQVVAPPLAVVETFERLVAPALDRIREALFESRSLATTRNTLLPKLISGELCIPDAERILEETSP